MRFFIALLFTITSFSSGFGQTKFMFVFLNPNPAKEELPEEKVKSLQASHLANIKTLAQEGKLLVAGPFDGGGGIFIMNTRSVEEAKEWINTDPAIKANRYKIEILPWTPRRGSACLAKADAEFETYTFIRFNSYITKFNVRDAPELFRQHDVYLQEIEKTGNVISEGVFDNSDGTTLIMEGDVANAVIMNDPSVKNGIIIPEIKKIWVAKGSFCENSN